MISTFTKNEHLVKRARAERKNKIGYRQCGNTADGNGNTATVIQAVVKVAETRHIY